MGLVPRLRLLVAHGTTRAVRPAGRRDEEHGAHGLLVERPRYESRRLQWPGFGRLAGVAQRAREEDDLHRSALQLHRGHQNDKWIAPRPGTDAALAEAIAYVWLTEGTYDKEYVAERTVGFEEFQKSVLGENDGVARTPEWAAQKCDLPARVIWALAREWASKRTTLSTGMRGGMGGACREAYGHEWARLMVLLQAMQGLGKPGVNIWGGTMGAPSNFDVPLPRIRERRHAAGRRRDPRQPGQAEDLPHPLPRWHPRPSGQVAGRGLQHQVAGAAVHPL